MAEEAGFFFFFQEQGGSVVEKEGPKRAEGD